MSQTWNFPMASTATLSDSRSYINDSCESQRTSFSGTSPPGSPVTGQLFYNTTTNELSAYGASSWYKLCNVNTNWGGLLPLSAGSAYPLSGDLYCGSNQIKSVADPSASQDAVTLAYLQTNYLALAGGTMSGVMVCGSYLPTASADPSSDTQLARKAYVDLHVEKAGDTMTGNLSFGDSYTATGLVAPSSASDAATKSYVDDEFDTSTGHDHDGTDSKEIDITNLSASGASSWGFVITTPTSDVTHRVFDIDSTAASQTAANGSYTTMATVNIALNANESRCVTFGFLHDDTNSITWRVRRDTSDIASNPTPFSAAGTYSFGVADSYSAGGGVTYTLQVAGQGATSSISYAWLKVM